MFLPNCKKIFCKDKISKIGRDPDSDWKMILFSFLIVIIVGAVYSGILFRQTADNQNMIFSPSEKKSSFDTNNLSMTIYKYEMKKQDFKSMITQPKRYTDPSI